MDVNLALARLRSLATTVHREQNGIDDPFTQRQAVNVLRQMTARFDELDGWFKEGGYPPTDWDPPRL